jgi:hypothetical protein
MTDDGRPQGRAPTRGYVQFTAVLARTICARVMAGESQVAICAEPDMPSRNTVTRWARERRVFGRALARARALGGRLGTATTTYCPVVAQEIAARVGEGEFLSHVCRDPAMPSVSTVNYWRREHPEFAAAMRVARETQAEAFCATGWDLATEATPDTAYLTQVRLAHLRWTASVLAPRSFGRLKPAEPPVEPVTKRILFRHFRIETHPQTGQQRVVGYTPDPTSMTPKIDAEGPWSRLCDIADLSEAAVAQRAAAIAAQQAQADAWDAEMEED